MPRAADLTQGLAADRARAGQRGAARGLAAGQPARDAPRARPCDCDTPVAGHAPRQGHLAGRGALDRGQGTVGLLGVRAAPGGGRRADPRPGPGAVKGARARALRRADRRIQPRLPRRGDRPAVSGRVPATAHPDPRRDRAAGRQASVANRFPGRPGAPARARDRGHEDGGLSVRPRPARRERRTRSPRACGATCASPRASMPPIRSPD